MHNDLDVNADVFYIALRIWQYVLCLGDTHVPLEEVKPGSMYMYMMYTIQWIQLNVDTTIQHVLPKYEVLKTLLITIVQVYTRAMCMKIHVQNVVHYK